MLRLFAGHRVLLWTKGAYTSIKRGALGSILEGASRFRSREGCYLYGRIRRTDFLPVGEAQEDEITERGMESASTDEDDGPQAAVRNVLAGRMRGFDDEDDFISSADEETDEEGLVRGPAGVAYASRMDLDFQ